MTTIDDTIKQCIICDKIKDNDKWFLPDKEQINIYNKIIKTYCSIECLSKNSNLPLYENIALYNSLFLEVKYEI